MKRATQVIIVLWALGLALLGGVLAQTATTGAIEGVVTDASGGVLPGVTVTVAGANLISAQTVTTNNEGRYRVLSLPPGKYTVRTEGAAGLARFEQPNVEVNLSRTTTLEVRMQPAGAATTVEVTGTGALVDVTANTSGSNVTTEQFLNFPTQRTVQSLYTIAPTVARSGLRDASGRDRDPSVAGASGPENSYILDGVTTTDPAFGGSGANIPFEFVQEVEIKTGAISAEYGLSTGGVFNVITKSGGNEFHGDVFTFFSTKGMVRETTSFPRTGSAPNGFSEVDAGFTLGGPIAKDKFWFFGAFNPQRRKNFFLTQTFLDRVESKITTPFYAGKLTYALNPKNTLTFSTFGDFTKEEGFLFGGSGFGATRDSFLGTRETGGHNYTLRLNSTMTPTFIGEFSVGIHRQRANLIPAGSVASLGLVSDNFAIRQGRTIATPTQSAVDFVTGGFNFGPVAYVNSPNGALERNFVRQGFGLFSEQDRNRWELQARLQNIWPRHTFKYGFEYYHNGYDINTRSAGPNQTFGNPQNLTFNGGPGNNVTQGFRVTNNFSVCTTRGNQIVCPSAAATSRAALIATAAGYSGGAITAPITAAEVNNNPFLVRVSTRVRDFQLMAQTHTNVEGFYLQDEVKVTRNLQITGALRWDFQQAIGNKDKTYMKLNKFYYNMQPRAGFIWDFTGKGRGKVFVNFAKYLETPIPLDVNVRAGSEDTQTDKNFNVDRLNAPAGANIVPGIRASNQVGAVNLGHDPTPIDPDIRPQAVYEVASGFEYEFAGGVMFGFRGIYKAQGPVIEDGSFDDGDTYFLFNPGQSRTDRLAGLPPCPDPLPAGQIQGQNCGGVGQRFGRARRYYRALEFKGTKRFSRNFQFITSYVYSSLIGNYEGLFRNDNGQSDPNITSLFDLVSLLDNTYGRLPNDRPHQFKLDGTYHTPIRLIFATSFRAQSGIPFNQLIPHPVYGNNEGFGAPRGSLGRTPSTTNWDLQFAYPIKFSDTKSLRLQLDWFNVLNHQHAIKRDETFLINSGVTGVPPVGNPFYRMGTIFQFPSNIRGGLKYTF